MTLKELKKYHTITREFQSESLESKHLFDFIPKVYGREDQLILRRWEDDFLKRDIPYVITEVETNPEWKKLKKTYTLWKEEVENVEAPCK